MTLAAVFALAEVLFTLLYLALLVIVCAANGEPIHPFNLVMRKRWRKRR